MLRSIESPTLANKLHHQETMFLLIESILLVIAFLLLLPSTVLFIECLAAFLPGSFK